MGTRTGVSEEKKTHLLSQWVGGKGLILVSCRERQCRRGKGVWRQVEGKGGQGKATKRNEDKGSMKGLGKRAMGEGKKEPGASKATLFNTKALVTK